MKNKLVIDFVDRLLKALLVWLGTVGIMTAWLVCFDIAYNLLFLLLFCAELSIVLTLIFMSEHQNIWMWIAELGVLGVAAWNYRNIRIAVTYCANCVLYVYKDYYDESYNAFYELDLGKPPKHPLSWYGTWLACILSIEIGYLIMILLYKKVYAKTLTVITIVAIAVPMAFGKFPPTLSIAAIMLFLFVSCSFEGQKKLTGRRFLYIAAVSSTALCLFVGNIRPQEYDRVNKMNLLKEGIESIGDKVSTFLDKYIWGKEENVATGGLSRGRLGRVSELELTEDPALEITLDDMQESIYLKGFSGDGYTGDAWIEKAKYDEASDLAYARFSMVFANSVFGYYLGNTDVNYSESYQLDPNMQKEVNQALLSMNYNYMSVYCDDSEPLTVGVYNLKKDDNYFYPYNSMIAARLSMNDLYLSGYDYGYTVDVLKYRFYNLGLDSLREMYADVDFDGAMLVDGESVYSDGYKMYAGYVRNTCMEIPVHLSEDLFPELFAGMEVPRFDGTLDSLYACQEFIRAYLGTHVTYDLAPGKMEGNDFIQDFLVNKKRGYCSHYASATVMMLRYMGVPARYAEGYVVGKEDFLAAEKNEDADIDGAYRLTVKENQAHAWAEAYVNGIGFIPVETTIGYYSEQGDDIAAQETSDRETDSTTEETTTEVNESSQMTSVTETTAQGNDGINGQNGRTVLEFEKENLPWALFVVVCIGMVGAVIAYLAREGEKNGGGSGGRFGTFDKDRQELLREGYEVFLLAGKLGVTYSGLADAQTFACRLDELLVRASQMQDKTPKMQEITLDMQEKTPKMQEIALDMPEKMPKMQEIALEMQENPSDTRKFVDMYLRLYYDQENLEITDDMREMIHTYSEKIKKSLQYLLK